MESSLNDLLNGTSELAEVPVNPDMPKLLVRTSKNPARESSETLSSKRIAGLITDLRERYGPRIVIFNLPPVLVADDAEPAQQPVFLARRQGQWSRLARVNFLAYQAYSVLCF